MSEVLYTVLIAAVALERLADCRCPSAMLRGASNAERRDRTTALPGDGGAAHRAQVGALLEVWLLHPEFHPALGYPMLALVVASQALRWWCIATLGRRWNTRVIVVLRATLVTGGPYRLTSHPNYVAVVVEGLALPLVYSAWMRARCVFTACDAVLLTVRLRVENAALRRRSPATTATSS